MSNAALRAMIPALSALLLLGAGEARAQGRSSGWSSGGSVSGGPRVTLPRHRSPFGREGRRHHRGGFGFGGVWVVEREVPVIIEREVVREVPVVVTPPPPPPPPRKPYVIGASYASLPGSCMKLIDGGVSYYYCDGEWYRQMGAGRSATYKAVAKP